MRSSTYRFRVPGRFRQKIFLLPRSLISWIGNVDEEETPWNLSTHKHAARSISREAMLSILFLYREWVLFGYVKWKIKLKTSASERDENCAKTIKLRKFMRKKTTIEVVIYFCTESNFFPRHKFAHSRAEWGKFSVLILSSCISWTRAGERRILRSVSQWRSSLGFKFI